MALLFKPAWQNKNPQKRILSLTHLPADKAAEITEQLASKDPDSAVRAAAIQMIASPGKLFQLIKQSEPAAQEQLRQALIASLDSEKSMALESRQRWLRNGDDNKVLSHIARYATEAALRKTALLQLDQQKLWQQCVVSDPAESNRALAITRISNINSLKQLIESVRKTDKKTTRLLQQTLEQRLLDEGDTATIQAVQLRLCEQLDVLIKQQADKTALRPIENEWAQVCAADSSTSNRLAERYQRARRVFLRLHETPSPATETKPVAPAAEPAEEETVANNHDALTNAAKKIAGTAEKWLGTDKVPRRKHFNQLREQWAGLKTELADSELNAKITESLSQLNHRLSAQDEQWKNTLAEVLAGIPNIKPALDEGQLQQAKKLYSEFEARLQSLKAIDNRAELRDAFAQLQNIKPSLEELAKWQHWGNDRQRRELCEKVEALIEQDIDPEALAEQIKAAQAEWKSLEKSEKADADKRKASPALWHRFQAACRKAWAPCAEHFEQKKQNRAAKLGHIEQAIEDLAAFADKTKQFEEQVLHTAVQSGYRMLGELHRMPRKESRDIEKSLRAALAPFQESQERVHKQAAYAKRQLIEKAQQLNPQEDLKAAIDGIKQLQADWKKSGRTDPKADRQLWQEFRQQADRVFATLDTQRQEDQQQRKQASDAFAAVIEQIKALATAVAANTAGELQKLRAEASVLEAEVDNRKLLSELEAAISTVKAALKSQKNQQRLSRLAELQQQAQQRQNKSSDETLEQQARDAVIKMEILAGAESPSEDKSRRLALQVDQLTANLNGSSKNTDLLSLAEQWYQNVSISAELWADLDLRVKQLISRD